jgi:2-polyprenyl-3-methyl-5-hydroxy-6-metoxy-1,4-benzoquinol methylase
MLRSTTGNTLIDVSLAIDYRIKNTGFDYSKSSKINIDICNLCGSNSFELYSHRDRYGLPVRSMKCKVCGLIFITPRMTDDFYDNFYKNWYRKLIAAFLGKNEDDLARTRSLDKSSDEIMKFLAKNMPDMQIHSMLDIGGSTGIFAEKICSTLGCEGVVVDPNRGELLEASNRGLITSCCQFMDYKTDRRFDLISMLKTIEHLSDIKKVFLKLKNLLTPEGVFLISIVNHDWLIKMFKDRNICTKIDHVYQLTDNTINQYFNSLFWEYDVVKGDTTFRNIVYLVKPKC